MNWRGKLLTELTREELIEAVEYCYAELRKHQTPEAIRQRAKGQACEFMESIGR